MGSRGVQAQPPFRGWQEMRGAAPGIELAWRQDRDFGGARSAAWEKWRKLPHGGSIHRPPVRRTTATYLTHACLRSRMNG